MAELMEKVREFHERFGAHIESHPGIPSSEVAALRVRLIGEEFGELQDAIADDDIVAVADALADLAYVIAGSAVSFGIDLDAVIDEVHSSNMTKLGPDGRPIRDAGGKVQKGPDYRPPDVAAVLARARG